VNPRHVVPVSRFDHLAQVIDARLGMLPAMRAPGRLFAVVADPCASDGFQLIILATGDPREIVDDCSGWQAPFNTIALAHSALGWSAPLPDAGEEMLRPSLHPQRRRAHTLTLVAGADELWSVVRIGDDEPHVWPDGVGLIPDGLRAAWAAHRRHPSLSAPPPPTRPSTSSESP